MYKVFISSVQAEFVQERVRICDYIRKDVLLRQYFEPFIFEETSAKDVSPQRLYLHEVELCDIYLLLVGVQYGNAGVNEMSPTQKEYECAKDTHKYKVAYIKTLENGVVRDVREEHFFRTLQKELTYREFSNTEVLLSAIHQTLYEYLKYKGVIQTKSFDELVHDDVTIDDIDGQKVADFVQIAMQKRGFPLPVGSPVEKVLHHLRLWRNGKPTNGAILAFGKDPQRFFPTAILKCAYFLGEIGQKPLADYKTFEGDVLEQINLATSWVLSKIQLYVGVRNDSVQNKIEYEIPRSVLFETIVNAVAHRDYQSMGSVQISVAHDRIVVLNPGMLPPELTPKSLLQEHGSYPHNPFLAEVLYQAGYIERFGTGITESVRRLQEANLSAPNFDLTAEFKTTLWRPNLATSIPNLATSTPNLATSASNLATNRDIIEQHISTTIKQRMPKTELEQCILRICIVEHSIDELADILNRKEPYLRNEIIPNLVEAGKLLPMKPKHSPGQRYLTNPKYPNL